MRLRIVACVLASLCSPARAADPARPPEAAPAADSPDAAFIKSRVEALYQEGLQLYQAERYREALPKFEAAQALFPDASLVYNIARCHEALGELDVAEGRYRALLADAAASPEVKAKAETRLTAMAALRTAPPPPVEPSPPTTEPASDPLPWVVIGCGAAALAAGGVVLTLGIADHTELDRSKQGKGREISPEKARQLDDDGAPKTTAGGLLMGLGATAIGVGFYLLLSEDEAPVTPTAGLGSLGLMGRF